MHEHTLRKSLEKHLHLHALHWKICFMSDAYSLHLERFWMWGARVWHLVPYSSLSA
jgi:hypothetical protein